MLKSIRLKGGSCSSSLYIFPMEFATAFLIRFYTWWFGWRQYITTIEFVGQLHDKQQLVGYDVQYRYSFEEKSWSSHGIFESIDTSPYVKLEWSHTTWDVRIENIEFDPFTLTLHQGVALGSIDLLTWKIYTLEQESDDTAFFQWTLFDWDSLPCSSYHNVKRCSSSNYSWIWELKTSQRIVPYKRYDESSIDDSLWLLPYSPRSALYTFFVSSNQSDVSETE